MLKGFSLTTVLGFKLLYMTPPLGPLYLSGYLRIVYFKVRTTLTSDDKGRLLLTVSGRHNVYVNVRLSNSRR